MKTWVFVLSADFVDFLDQIEFFTLFVLIVEMEQESYHWEIVFHAWVDKGWVSIDGFIEWIKVKLCYENRDKLLILEESRK